MADTKKKYDPYKIRRRVRRDQSAPDYQAGFVTKSFTQPDNEDRWHPTIDRETGAATCDCTHFTTRLRRAHINEPASLCKHLQRAVANMERDGDIPPLAERLAEFRRQVEQKAKENIARLGSAYFDF